MLMIIAHCKLWVSITGCADHALAVYHYNVGRYICCFTDPMQWLLRQSFYFRYFMLIILNP